MRSRRNPTDFIELVKQHLRLPSGQQFKGKADQFMDGNHYYLTYWPARNSSEYTFIVRPAHAGKMTLQGITYPLKLKGRTAAPEAVAKYFATYLNKLGANLEWLNYPDGSYRESLSDYILKNPRKRVNPRRRNPSLRAPTSYTRRMASEFWHGETTGADDDQVWSFAWEEASAAGLSGRAADKHANAALRMVQARDKVRGIARAVGMKRGAAGSGKKPGAKKAKANPRGKQALLTQSRVPWSKFTTAEIRAIHQEALLHGDYVLAQKAKNALDRR